jgi:hypothetical protein
MAAIRIKHRADRGTRALKRLALIGDEIIQLPDEDLLDLVDIFSTKAASIVGELATAEMNKRGLSLYAA